VAIEYEASSIERVPSLPAFGDARSIIIATSPKFWRLSMEFIGQKSF